MPPPARKALYFIASSWKDLKGLPGPVQDTFGTLLLDVQYGETPGSAKPLRGFGGAGVLEIIEDHDGDTYRCVYTVSFRDAVYVLHAFQKKSKHGIATSKRDLALVRNRHQMAERHHATLKHEEDRHA
ncbi:MAG: type II toxin-antitoxin system RelE/ParE family toxin [Candidatus Binatia bacterium]